LLSNNRAIHFYIEVIVNGKCIKFLLKKIFIVSSLTNDGIQRQHQQTELLASAMEQMLVAAEEVARGAVNAADAAYRADISAENGEEMVGEIIVSIKDISQVVSNTASESEQIQQVNRNLEKLPSESHQLVKQFVV